jgi:hypothetical protein
VIIRLIRISRLEYESRASMGQDDLSVKLIPEGEDVNVHKGWLIKSKIEVFDTSKY